MPSSKTETTAPLLTPLERAPGIGAQNARLLGRLRLHTVRDLLFLFPRDYRDLTDLDEADEAEDGQLVRMRGEVVEIDQRPTSSGGTVVGVLFKCGTRHVRGLWFNQPYIVKRFAPGQQVLLEGKVKVHIGVWEMTHPLVQTIEADAQTSTSTLVPVYPLTAGLTQQTLVRMIECTLDHYLSSVEEVLPAEFLAEHDLLGIHEALRGIHAPQSREALERARRRFVFQELLVLQLALCVRRSERRNLQTSPELKLTPKIDARIRRLFPFTLTEDQNRAIAEVAEDMGRSFPMNRLLQGEVGSGKTVVALYAMLLAVACGRQAVLMAPTELLARQHAQTLERYLSESQVRWAVLTGSSSAAERRAALAGAADGTLDVLIGTQAILHSGVEYARLGLVVIDEQHKFGVRQRAGLRRAGIDPHYLVMTATPIPRTVAMTQFGDLDVSTIRDLPPGRHTARTYLADDTQREKWWDFFRRKLREGRQGYVVLPRVEDEDETTLRSVHAAYEALANGPLEEFRIDLMHGRMPASEKLPALERFQSGETQVLVTTSLVEVGIDVPNATLMTIESAEQFGLAQLHQLRGRIARGKFPGYCCVFTGAAKGSALERLQAFADTTDGFALAELDLAQRGPGSLLGARQHGLPPLRVADLARDAEVLDEAGRAAEALLAADPQLAVEKHERLRRMVFTRYGRVLQLGDVG